jgi:hypothetical protein
MAVSLSALFRTGANRFKSLKQCSLRRIDLFVCGSEIEPFRTIDFRKCLAAACVYRKPYPDLSIDRIG